MKYRKYVIIMLVSAGLYLPLFAESGMQAGFFPASTSIRSGSPVPGELKISQNERKIHEGHIVITVLASSRDILYEYAYGPVAIVEKQEAFLIILPPVLFSYSSSLQLNMTFEYNNGTRIKLGRSILNMSSAEHIFSAAFCFPDYMKSDSRSSLLAHLRLEFMNFNSKKNRDYGGRRLNRRFHTGTHILSPEEMRTDPYFYCGFDVLVLYGNTLGQLRRKQLNAIETWVKAGGSLCVIPEAPLSEIHMSFLNRLCRSNTGTAPFMVDKDGHLVYINEADQNRCTYYSCMGRTVVVTNKGRFAPQWNSAEWKRAVCFLWKIKHKREKTLFEQNRWADKDNEFSFQLHNLQAGDMIRNLFPKRIKIIPVGLVILMLILLLILIGPFDYYVLGWLKRRRYTWLFFPAVCIGTGFLTILISQWYMGNSDSTGKIEITDIDSEGNIIRQSRYELWFPSSNRELEQDINTSLLTRMNYVDYFNDYYYYGRYNRGTESRSSPLKIQGRFPNRYTVCSELRKWSPQLQRHFRFGNGEKVKGLNKKEFQFITEKASLFDNPAEAKSRCADFSGIVFLAQKGKLSGISNYTRNIADRRWLMEICSRRSRETGRHSGRYGYTSNDEQYYEGDNGLFAHVFQISPTGGEGFSDLALTDPDSESQAVLVLVKKKGVDTFVFRRLLTRE